MRSLYLLIASAVLALDQITKAMILARFSEDTTVSVIPGLLRLVGPTGGYLMAYPVAAFVTGWLAERGWDRHYLTSVSAMLLGLAIIFTGGVTWLVVAFDQLELSACVSEADFPGSAMPAWKGTLTDEQMWHLVNYLHTLR